MPNLIIILLLFFACGFSQNKFDIDNLLQYGEFKYAPNDDKPYTGKIFDLYSNGSKRLEGMYSKGKKNGKWSYYNKSGELLCSNIFKMGEFIGDTLYHIDNNLIVLKESFINGKKNGKSIHYSDEGRIILIEEYLDGVQNGIFISYYKNGFKRITANYINGIKSGYFSEHNEFGKILFEGYIEETEMKFYPDNYDDIRPIFRMEKFIKRFDENCNCYILNSLNGRPQIYHEEDEIEDEEIFREGSKKWDDWEPPPPPSND